MYDEHGCRSPQQARQLGDCAANIGSFRGVFRARWSALSKEVQEYVGTDQFGNKYYYVPEDKN